MLVSVCVLFIEISETSIVHLDAPEGITHAHTYTHSHPDG